MNNMAIIAKAAEASHGVSINEAFRVWLRVALLSFGGPAGQIAMMHRILVDEKKWVSESSVPSRPQLLHVAARPRRATARDLHRLADAQDARRHHRGRSVRFAGRDRDHDAQRHLRRLRQLLTSSFRAELELGRSWRGSRKFDSEITSNSSSMKDNFRY